MRARHSIWLAWFGATATFAACLEKRVEYHSDSQAEFQAYDQNGRLVFEAGQGMTPEFDNPRKLFDCFANGQGVRCGGQVYGKELMRASHGIVRGGRNQYLVYQCTVLDSLERYELKPLLQDCRVVVDQQKAQAAKEVYEQLWIPRDWQFDD